MHKLDADWKVHDEDIYYKTTECTIEYKCYNQCKHLLTRKRCPYLKDTDKTNKFMCTRFHYPVPIFISKFQKFHTCKWFLFRR